MTTIAEFVVDTPDGEIEFPTAGSTAEYLLGAGFAHADREPHWHMRWCLDRMEPGESMDVGNARVIREATQE
ncbi:hypothetical protein ACFT2C_12725 [Promicromonospora sp. NPDC057138]|uniref:hypothetical protein n=1 Tax=Promicromonospora sp. NPDC057138 TaxID=3346031 RepID=UPI00362F4517